MSSKPLIRLYNSQGVGVIILCPSGVLYSNQAGGLSCLQPEIEGVYVPLACEPIDQEEMLEQYFTGPKWLGCCSNGIDDEDANEIDRILGLSLPTRFIKVDRSQLKDSCEAWVYVNIAAQPKERPRSYNGSEGKGTTASGEIILDSDYDLGVLLYPFYGFGNCSGILIWMNSD